jgi:hypothetical protein
MFEVIGFIFYVLFALAATAAPFFVLVIGGLGGVMGNAEKLIIFALWAIAAWCWYEIFSRVTITVGI